MNNELGKKVFNCRKIGRNTFVNNRTKNDVGSIGFSETQLRPIHKGFESGISAETVTFKPDTKNLGKLMMKLNFISITATETEHNIFSYESTPNMYHDYNVLNQIRRNYSTMFGNCVDRQIETLKGI